MKLNKEERKEEYNYYKEHKVCVQCHSRSAFNGMVRCPECLEKASSTAAKLRSNCNKEIANERRRKYRALLKGQGRCSKCGGALDDARFVTCTRCRRISSESKKVSRVKLKTLSARDIEAEKTLAMGLCPCQKCGKPTYGYYKLCKHHYDISKANALHARKKSKFVTSRAMLFPKGVMNDVH